MSHPDGHLSWGVQVGEMLIRRTALARIAPDLFPETLPGTRATAAGLAAVRARLGFDLDPQHEAVLREGDGWVDAFAYGDVLSTADLGAGPRWEVAEVLLESYYEYGALPGFPPLDSIYPIHVADDALFVVDRSGPVTDGGQPVYWLSDELLGRWPNVYEYWCAGLTMLDRLATRVAADGGRAT
ncbi:hypothetical protein [Cellulomonas sp.]|uniref:hypothetical protein n=1 Tax=Cellulomonas sp. TaxID=40001 RepID=UPI002D364FFC|nr:hypothetical protein [Cellulomonas sp.]HYQ74584.1 hypothetical protein [Cellulomonas sp.]